MRQNENDFWVSFQVRQEDKERIMTELDSMGIEGASPSECGDGRTIRFSLQNITKEQYRRLDKLSTPTSCEPFQKALVGDFMLIGTPPFPLIDPDLVDFLNLE